MHNVELENSLKHNLRVLNFYPEWCLNSLIQTEKGSKEKENNPHF
jgi:hypothetical protein